MAADPKFIAVINQRRRHLAGWTCRHAQYSPDPELTPVDLSPESLRCPLQELNGALPDAVNVAAIRDDPPVNCWW